MKEALFFWDEVTTSRARRVATADVVTKLKLGQNFGNFSPAKEWPARVSQTGILLFLCLGH